MLTCLMQAASERAAQQLAVLGTSQSASQKKNRSKHGNNYQFHLHLLLTPAGTHSIAPVHLTSDS